MHDLLHSTPRIFGIIAALATLGALGPMTASAEVLGTVSASCVGSSHRVGIEYMRDSAASGLVGVQFRQVWVGECRPAVLVPEEPIAIPIDLPPEQMLVRMSTQIEAPATNVVFRYTAVGVFADGHREDFQYSCSADMRNYALVTCGTAPIARGYFGPPQFVPGSGFKHEFISCNTHCWSIDLKEISADEFGELAASLETDPHSLQGATLDIFGNRTYCELPGDDEYTITGVSLVEGGACGSVPVSSSGWGTLKSQFH